MVVGPSVADGCCSPLVRGAAVTEGCPPLVGGAAATDKCASAIVTVPRAVLGVGRSFCGDAEDEAGASEGGGIA